MTRRFVHRFPASLDELREIAPEELEEMCRVINAILDLCKPDSARFDSDELGIDPEEDY